MTALLSRADKSVLAQWWWTVDRRLLAVFLLLFVIGIALVSAASPSVAIRINADPYHFIVKHAVFMMPAIVAMVTLSFCAPITIRRLALVGLAGSALFLVSTLFIGQDIKGAQRWINIFGFTLQPSEFIKPCFIVVSAWLIAHQQENTSFPGYKICAGLYLGIIFVLLLQPDLGMTILITAMICTQIFLVGMPFRYIFMFFGVALVGLVVAYMTLGHVQSRIDRFIDPSSGDTYQIQRSMEAFMNGGFLGAGPGQGEVKTRIPDAHADFIISVAGEELGIIFIFVLIGLYGFIVLRGFSKIMDHQDMFIILSVGGLLVMFGGQAFVHMASALSLIPTKGMTLPLISYGGSSMLSLAAAAGFILALIRDRTGVTTLRVRK